MTRSPGNDDDQISFRPRTTECVQLLCGENYARAADLRRLLNELDEEQARGGAAPCAEPCTPPAAKRLAVKLARRRSSSTRERYGSGAEVYTKASDVRNWLAHELESPAILRKRTRTPEAAATRRSSALPDPIGLELQQPQPVGEPNLPKDAEAFAWPQLSPEQILTVDHSIGGKEPLHASRPVLVSTSRTNKPGEFLPLLARNPVCSANHCCEPVGAAKVCWQSQPSSRQTTPHRQAGMPHGAHEQALAPANDCRSSPLQAHGALFSAHCQPMVQERYIVSGEESHASQSQSVQDTVSKRGRSALLVPRTPPSPMFAMSMSVPLSRSHSPSAPSNALFWPPSPSGSCVISNAAPRKQVSGSVATHGQLSPFARRQSLPPGGWSAQGSVHESLVVSSQCKRSARPAHTQVISQEPSLPLGAQSSSTALQGQHPSPGVRHSVSSASAGKQPRPSAMPIAELMVTPSLVPATPSSISTPRSRELEAPVADGAGMGQTGGSVQRRCFPLAARQAQMQKTSRQGSACLPLELLHPQEGACLDITFKAPMPYIQMPSGTVPCLATRDGVKAANRSESEASMSPPENLQGFCGSLRSPATVSEDARLHRSTAAYDQTHAKAEQYNLRKKNSSGRLLRPFHRAGQARLSGARDISDQECWEHLREQIQTLHQNVTEMVERQCLQVAMPLQTRFSSPRKEAHWQGPALTSPQKQEVESNPSDDGGTGAQRNQGSDDASTRNETPSGSAHSTLSSITADSTSIAQLAKRLLNQTCSKAPQFAVQSKATLIGVHAAVSSDATLRLRRTLSTQSDTYSKRGCSADSRELSKVQSGRPSGAAWPRRTLPARSGPPGGSSGSATARVRPGGARATAAAAQPPPRRQLGLGQGQRTPQGASPEERPLGGAAPRPRPCSAGPPAQR